jgi:hypothetical protein
VVSTKTLEETPQIPALPDSTALAEGALICSWLDINPADHNEFREFHDREHLFERLDLSGFNRGRRFGAIDASADFLIIYEVDDLATLTSEAYLARLNSPTPSTLRSVAKVKKTRRACLRIAYSRGRARGGFVLALRCEALDGQGWGAASCKIWDHLASRPGVVALHAGTSDELTSNLDTVERSTGSRTSAWVQQRGEQILIVEGTSSDVLRDLVHDQLSEQRMAEFGIRRRIDVGIYGLQISVEAPAGGRRRITT